MNVCPRILAVIVACLCLPEISAALDYNPSWKFTTSIGDQPLSLWGKDFLIYDNSTGSLAYQVGDSGRWLPPDIGSKSGLLSVSTPLQPVPLGGTPTFRVDETFGGGVVLGSNAIRIYYDGYMYWPWSPLSPELLQMHGLDRMPDAYSYGAVLPPGLSEDILQSDLYAAFFPGGSIELQVVPEPAVAWMLGALGLLIGTCRLSVARGRRSKAFA
jgi:hypothetical protein